MPDGQFRLARYMNGTDLPTSQEPAFDQRQAEARAKAIATAILCLAWIEEADGQIRRVG